MPRLTKRVVDKAKPRTARYTIFDDEIKGFGLRVFPSGAKHRSGVPARQRRTASSPSGV